MRQQDDIKRDGNDCAEDDIDILDDREYITGSETASTLHTDSAQQYNDQCRGIQDKRGYWVNDCHAYIRADDIVSHDMCSVSNTFMCLWLPVERANDADAAQAFAYQIVLLVAVLVGDVPEMLDPLAHEQARGNQKRYCADDHNGKENVFAHAKEDTTQERQRDDQNPAAEHGDDLIQGAYVMRGACDQVGSPEASDFFQRHGVDLTEKCGAQAPCVTCNDFVNDPVAAGYGKQTGQREPEHPGRSLQNIAECVAFRSTVYALVQNIGHERGQQ